MHRRCWYMNLSALLILAIFSGSVSARCDRTPENNPYPRTSADDRFHIQISGNPETYVPGEQYTVFLRGTINTLEQHKFKDFLLVIEPEQQELAGHAVRGPGIIPSVGHFTLLGDALTKFSDVCPNAVSQTNSLPKTEIQVFWKAPPSGSGCVAFRATVLEQRDLWYMDEGDLTRILCEEVTETDDTQPPVLGKCCACDEAKYEVTFEGLWSRNTHPKDFPSNGWLTRFSDVIGASHTRNYTFWNYGEYASEGLRQVAENGNTRMLESELKGKSDHIRTIIKARGISYPNVTGKTFAVFRVDNQHHLMSLVSMIDPSPDWFVGVSSLELCLRNCSWIESKILNLYPWDAGTDDGWTYISPDQPSTPRSPIRRIKSNSPNDPRSPFYDPTGVEMKPLARLYLSRQRLYEKPCDSVDPDPDPQDDCEVTEWSVWSPCSATCGRGTKYRQRKYVRDSSKYHCTKHLTSRASCWGPQRVCPDHSEDRLNDPMCALTDWSEWSSCSVTCGRGVRTRDRRYMTRNATKHCTHGIKNPHKLKDTEKCWGEGPCSQEENGGDNDEIPECPSRPWSDWSPCSVTCGYGSKMRLRDPVNTEANYEEDDEGGTSVGDEEDDPCDDERDKEIVVCQAEIPTCDINSGSAEDICRLPKDVGPCRANIQRWYFDVVRAKCDSFSFSGCQGNRNNFDTQEYCEKVCGQFRKELVANRTEQKNKLGVSVSGVLSYNLQLQDDANIGANCVTRDPINDYEVGGFIANSQLNGDHTYVTVTPNVVNCETSPWSAWGPCNSTKSCGRGFKHKHREILTHPMNGGQACPKKLLRTKKCRIPCKNKDRTNNYEKYNMEETDGSSSWSDLNPVWGSPSLNSEISQDCMMSKWTPWSPCSVTCGTMAVQQRTRRILQHARGGGQPCMSRVETKPCPVLPCPYTTAKYTTKIDNNAAELSEFPVDRIRNFSIIAHVDHGKSTLADRLLEITGAIAKNAGQSQVLDKLQVERERGITVKAQSASLLYNYKGRQYLLNLIDTPGHVDFSNEVSRSLSACQGVVLLIDANDGVQAQTVANFYLAFGQDLVIVPVINKIDLKNADPDKVCAQLQTLFDIEPKDVLRISAKLGTNVSSVLDAIIDRLPPPPVNRDGVFKALLFDSWFDRYRGALNLIYVHDGSVRVGESIMSCHTGKNYEIKSLAVLRPQEQSVKKLNAGQIGLVGCNMRTSKEAHIGDTLCLTDSPVEPLKGFVPAKPMVFAGVYPMDQSQHVGLRSAIEKLVLNDPAVTVAIDSSPALGQGWRLGFLGLLHLEVFSQRLQQEYSADPILTAPSVTYKVKLKPTKHVNIHGTDTIYITNPALLPDPRLVEEYFEPMVIGTIITPSSYLGPVISLCIERRGIQRLSTNIDNDRVMLQYDLPLCEIVIDFHDTLKSITSGYASFDYEDNGYQASSIVKLSILLNGVEIDELCNVVHSSKAQTMGRKMCAKLKEMIPRQLIQIAIQAAVGSRILARETLKAFRKDVTAKLYGGDVTRRMKLLARQAEGKRRMKSVANISIPRETFIDVLKR